MVKSITPRSGAVDADPGRVIFGGASSPVIRQNKNITSEKLVWTHLFQHNHVNSAFVQSAQISESVCNTAQCMISVFV